MLLFEPTEHREKVAGLREGKTFAAKSGGRKPRICVRISGWAQCGSSSWPACVECPGHISAQGLCMLYLARFQGTSGLPEEIQASVFSSAPSFIQPSVKMISNSYQISLKLSWHLQGWRGIWRELTEIQRYEPQGLKVSVLCWGLAPRWVEWAHAVWCKKLREDLSTQAPK